MMGDGVQSDTSFGHNLNYYFTAFEIFAHYVHKQINKLK